MRGRPFAGRTEHDVHRELVERMLDAGHERANFAIVATGPNAASPHHEPGIAVIADGDVVLVRLRRHDARLLLRHHTHVRRSASPPAEVADAYAVLVEAQEAGVQAATVGTPCEAVDAAARRVIAGAGLGDRFVHRTGHGIGMEAHEDPYLVAGNVGRARARVTRSASSPASTCPVASACASRTSSWPPTTARDA